ncbi:MAG: carboxypeptidase-like regulatory domain-containing protein [Spirochaetes bacterium]|nr:carboxypeptidase-like regulatory domain-containing protein [Spirochaetota bacterium]
MRKNKRIQAIAGGILLIALLSCATESGKTPYDFKTAPLIGMLYDRENKPCAGASVFIDGIEKASTDINGRFAVPGVSRGTHTVAVKKEGYEKEEFTFEFLSRSQVVYLRVYSFDQLLDEAEAAIAERSWAEAEDLIERAKAVRRDDPVGLFLEAVLFNEQKQYHEAKERLERIIDLGYREPYVYLALADIHQYGLDDRESAAACLEEYLALKDDDDVRNRLEGLRAQP